MKDQMNHPVRSYVDAARRAGILVSLLILSLFGSIISLPQARADLTPESRLAFAARVDGNWDIYSIRPDGADLRRITTDPAEDRAPAYSPDGARLLFQSRRDGNWEIYCLTLATGELKRLTHHLAYDGMPAWSPSGDQIAFESMRAGDLDIFVMSSEGDSPRNLTADSPAGDMEPAWSPDGSRIAFTTWREQDKDLYSMSADGADLVQLAVSPLGEDQPAWSPDGLRVAFVHRTPAHREVLVLNTIAPPAQDGLTTRLTWSTANEWPTWSPAGRQLAWLEQTYRGWTLRVAGLMETATLPDEVIRGRALSGPLSWSEHALPYGEPLPADTLRTRQPYAFSLNWAWPDAEPTDRTLVGWGYPKNVEVSNERLNVDMVAKFDGFRQAILDACGRDFLAQLSDAWRPLTAESETSSYSSWHKSGRAIDLLFDYRDENRLPLIEMVREDIGGRTYWRLYLKCRQQDGSQGTPMREHAWDFSGSARLANPDLGGRWESIPVGYYVDITDLADTYGWDRISAIDKPDYSWKWHFLAIEYWHFQQDEGLTWYSAMQQVYDDERLSALFNWRELQRQDIKEWFIVHTGVPIPLSESRWRLLHP
jgi:TolB protein